MDYIWIAIAFSFGFIIKQFGLPPLIGYLAAGFALNAMGLQANDTIDALSNIGILLLLFTVGLKIHFKSLLRPAVWAGASGHMLAIVLLTTINSLVLAYLGLQYFDGLDWRAAALIAFAVSFSSTVCAVKMLEERGELRSNHGQVAIGILIIQDIAAVLFVVLTSDTTPSLWALGLLALPLAKPILNRLIDRCGHGEMLTLAGFFLAFGAGELFALTGLKAYLGALVFGMLLSNHAKASELADTLLGFKDIFLIGFFLSIGFTALPTVDMLFAALIMAVALPIKAAMFFVWLTRLQLRSRSAFLAALSLANYSEFGLIVASFSVAGGLLAKEWLVIMALAVSISFVFSSVLNSRAHRLYCCYSQFIKRFERSGLGHPEAHLTADKTVIVIGMGRVGVGAYEALLSDPEQSVCGIELDKARAEQHKIDGRVVIAADAADPDFWADADLGKVELVMLAMPSYQDILATVNQLHEAGYRGKTAGIAKYPDQQEALLAAGVDEVFNLYAEAGAGFAEQSVHLLGKS